MLKGTYIDHLDFCTREGWFHRKRRQGDCIHNDDLPDGSQSQSTSLQRDRLEERLKTYLCAKRVQWMNHGNPNWWWCRRTYKTLVRIAPDDTLITLVWWNKTDLIVKDWEKMERACSLTPRTMRQQILIVCFLFGCHSRDGEGLPATYANYPFISRAVIVPACAGKGPSGENRRNDI